MEDLEKLKEMLCEELEKYGRKGEMSAGTLEIVDKLAHAIKNLDKIIDGDEYSGAYEGGRDMSYRGGSYRGGSYRGGSYARRRDRMGRYSSEGYSRHDLAEELRALMDEAPDEKTRMEMERLVNKMEQR